MRQRGFVIVVDPRPGAMGAPQFRAATQHRIAALVVASAVAAAGMHAWTKRSVVARPRVRQDRHESRRGRELARDATEHLRERCAILIQRAADLLEDWRDTADARPSTQCQSDARSERRDRLYDELGSAASRIRLTAPVEVLEATEAMLTVLASAQAMGGRGEFHLDLPRAEQWAHVEQAFVSARQVLIETVRAAYPPSGGDAIHRCRGPQFITGMCEAKGH